MKKFLVGLIIGAILFVPISVKAYNEPGHWKDNSIYQIDRHKDGAVTCYVAYDHRANGYPPPSISCVRAN